MFRRLACCDEAPPDQEAVGGQARELRPALPSTAIRTFEPEVSFLAWALVGSVGGLRYWDRLGDQPVAGLRSVIVAGGLAALAYIAYRYFTKQPVSIPTQLV